MLMERPKGTTAELGDVEISALSEFANVASCCFIRDLADLAEVSMEMTPPEAVVDMAAAVLEATILHLWEQTEPASWLPYAAVGVDGIGPKALVEIAAHNDAQVPNLATDVAMRIAGVPVLSGSSREPWGLDVVEEGESTSAYVTIDLGDPDVPEGNVFPEVDEGGHSDVGATWAAQEIMRTFFAEGRVAMPCDGICDPD
jgi:hypothetical protein